MEKSKEDEVIMKLKKIFSTENIEADDEEFGVSGFASFQRKMHVVDKNLHLFSKSSSSGREELGDFKDFSVQACKNEVNFYGVIAPLISMISKRHRLLSVLPEVYYHEVTDNGTALVMEDLTKQGFKLGHKNLDRKEIQAALKSFAHLNAAFYIARESFNFMLDPVIAKGSKFERTMSDSGFGFDVLLENGFRMLKASIGKFLTDEEAAELLAFYDRRTELKQKLLDEKCSKENLLGLSHGDLWFGNIFLKETGDDFECRIFDWQGWRVNTMTQDIGLFLTSSTTDEVIVNDFDAIVEDFYSSFKEPVEEATGKPLKMTLEEFRDGCVDSFLYWLMWILGAAPALLSEASPIEPGVMMKSAVNMIRHFDLKNRQL